MKIIKAPIIEVATAHIFILLFTTFLKAYLYLHKLPLSCKEVSFYIKGAMNLSN